MDICSFRCVGAKYTMNLQCNENILNIRYAYLFMYKNATAMIQIPSTDSLFNFLLLQFNISNNENCAK